jgi:hypothetical protein
MFVLAFAGIGLFANASIGKVNSKSLVEKTTKTLISHNFTKTTDKVTVAPPGGWSFSVGCGNGNVVVGCCWATAEEALNAGIAAASVACASAA